MGKIGRVGNLYYFKRPIQSTNSGLVNPARLGLNLYDSRKLARELRDSLDINSNARLSSLGDEMKIYEADRSGPYESVLSRSPLSPIIVTDTVLRVPPGWENGRSDFNKGQKVYPRIVLEHGEKVADVYVPGVIGSPTVPANALNKYGTPTRIVSDKRGKHKLHFIFNDRPEVDRVSRERDVVVVLHTEPLHLKTPRCLTINATFSPYMAHENFGLRLVYGGRK